MELEQVRGFETVRGLSLGSPNSKGRPGVEFNEFLDEISSLGGEKLLTSIHTAPILELIFDAVQVARTRPESRVLNFFASNDRSGFRENIYRSLFKDANYETVDFWEDKFIFQGETLPNSYALPIPSDSIDAIITTKILLEHISEPGETIKEFVRILRPGGEVFLVAPFAMAIHQPPHDYFRFTEHGLRHLFKKTGLEVVYIRPTLSAFMTAMDALTHSDFFGMFPRIISSRLKKYWKRWIMPLAMRLDRRVTNSGKLCRHYICRGRKLVLEEAR